MKYKKTIIASVIVVGLVSAGLFWAARLTKIESTPLRGNLHVLYGFGGNIVVSAGDDGVFIIDDQYAPLTWRVIDAIETISDKPIRYIMNTHFHMDHTGGNENLGKKGSIIIAHDNVRTRIRDGGSIKAYGVTMEPQLNEAMPVITFNENMSLYFNGNEAHAMHVEHAHTDGDSIISLPEANIVIMGDVFFNSGFPFIVVENGGSIDGVIAAVHKALDTLIEDATIVVPGHGVVTDKARLQEYVAMLESTRKIIAGLKASGKTAEEMIAERSLADFEGEWGARGEADTARYINAVFNSIEFT